MKLHVHQSIFKRAGVHCEGVSILDTPHMKHMFAANGKIFLHQLCASKSACALCCFHNATEGLIAASPRLTFLWKWRALLKGILPKVSLVSSSEPIAKQREEGVDSKADCMGNCMGNSAHIFPVDPSTGMMHSTAIFVSGEIIERVYYIIAMVFVKGCSTKSF
jgi:hypothetical protein